MSIGAAAKRTEPEDSYAGEDTASMNALKSVAAERLAAHRQRREREKAGAVESEARQRAQAEAARKESRRGAQMVREAVAARYQQSQSYREFLAAEADRALQQAQAEAEVARRNAEAVAQVQQDLLAEIAEWEQPAQPLGPREVPAPAASTPAPVAIDTPTQAAIRNELIHELTDIVMGAQELMAEPPLVAEVPASGLTVRLYEDVAPKSSTRGRTNSVPHEEPGFELEELEEEIAFRRAPEFQAITLETQAIPANIIEFPRQLIAPRRARPRIAEGPLRDEGSPAEPQLRIFEVEPEQIAIEPERSDLSPSSAAPEWQSLLLEASIAPRTQPHGDADNNLAFQPQAAPAHQRLLAAAVDFLCVGAAFAAFAGTIVHFCGRQHLLEMKLPVIAGAAAGSLFVFALAFQMLFFTFSDATPGMRYARIALCTFGDDHPSRQAMRRRAWATILAACPLGLGFAWIWMDNDRLGWHDRISRMYQRAY